MFRVHVRCALNASSEDGRDGIGLIRTLSSMGMWVTVEPTEVSVPIPTDISQVLTRQPEAPFDLALHLVPLKALGSGKELTAYRSVAWTRTSELSGYVPREQLQGYDSVVALDDQTADVLAAVGVPARCQPAGFAPDVWAVDSFRDWHATPLQLGLVSRNGDIPAALVAAVEELAGQVALCVKTEKVAGAPTAGVELVAGDWPEVRMLDFYLGCHVFAHLGSGRGLTALEAGSSGCALLLTDTADHRRWHMPEMGPLVSPGAAVGELVEVLGSLAEEREKVRQMGTQASRIIPRAMSWESAVRSVVSDTRT